MTLTERHPLIAKLKGGLIVSVQADSGSPLDSPQILAALARSVIVPGVVGLRMNAPANIRAARAITGLPIIGIQKTYDEDGRVWITPGFAAAKSLAQAGAEIIALDATSRTRSPAESVPALVERIHKELDALVMADISNLDEGLAAAQAGADLVSTTLSGYTRAPFAGHYDPPDLELLHGLSRSVDIPVIAEGRFNTPDLAVQALQSGAYAVVVGSAITRPAVITEHFVAAIQKWAE